MNYVEHLNLFGVEAKEIPCIKGSGAPTTSTVGAVGLFYMDTTNGDVWKCTAVSGGKYTWVPAEAKDVVRFSAQTLTDAQKTQARANIGAAGKDDIPIYTITSTKTADVVSVSPIEDTTVSVVTKFTGVNTTAFTEQGHVLQHIRSENMFDFVTLFGGPGHPDGNTTDLTVTINADSTVTVSGTIDSSGYYVLARKLVSPLENGVGHLCFPAGTYTVPSDVTIQMRSIRRNEANSGYIYLDNQIGTFTVDEPFVITGVYLATYFSSGTINKTSPMYIVKGSGALSGNYGFEGEYYLTRFTNPVSDGSFDWQTGILTDVDGNVVETTTAIPPFEAFDGINTFLCGVGDCSVTYKKLLDGDDISFSASSNTGSGADNVFDPTEYDIPILYINGQTSGMSKDNPVNLKYSFNGRSGTCEMKWQGSSSIAYAKKNYTIKFDTAFEAAEGWGEQKKYCLKANFIDHSHVRNVVNAKLWGQVLDTRKTSVHNNLRSAPNYGAVDGFPVIVMLNDKFHGLYTFNIPKDGWMMGMGSGTNEAIVCADKWIDATYFKAPANLSDDFKLEYVSDEANTDWVTISLNRLIDACINSDGIDLDTTIAQYVDLQSAIDYYIFAVLITGYDMTGKNYLLSTFDGTKWYFGAYDMDCTHGLTTNGSEYMSADTNPSFESYAAQHRLMELIKTYKADAVKARYAQLRNSVLSESNIAMMFGNFAGKIPSPVYMQDAKKWPMIPNTSTNNISQIRDYYRMRVALADKWIEEL